MNCVFCKISKAEIPAKIVYEDEEMLGFLDIKPINLGHTLIIPKNHYENLLDVPEEIFGKMAQVGKRVSLILKNVLGPKCEGVNLFLANGKAAGQEVFHIHLHIIPRWEGDGFRLKFPPHYGLIPEKETQLVHSKILNETEEK